MKVLEDLIHSNKILKPSEEKIVLTKVFDKPEIYEVDTRLMLLFNVIIKSNLEEDGGLEVFHNILVIFHKQIGTMEIRLDVVPNRFKSSKITGEFNDITFRSALAWLEANLGLVYEIIVLEPITKYMRKYEQEEVAIARQEVVTKF